MVKTHLYELIIDNAKNTEKNMELVKRELLREQLRNFGGVFVLFLLINQASGQFEGEKCRINVSTIGTCTKLQGCPFLSLAPNPSFDLKKLVTCSYDKFTPIVCCPITEEYAQPAVSTTPTPRHPDQAAINPNREIWEKAAVFPIINDSKEKAALERKCASPRLNVTVGNAAVTACEEYSKHFIPSITYHIIQGKFAERGQFPYMAAVGSWDDRNKSIEWLCGGALISDQWVVTTAHCVNETGKYIVRLGAWDLSVGHEEGVALSVQKIIFHPDYKLPEYYNDIALLQLRAAVKYNASSTIYPVCIDTKSSEQLVYATAVWSKVSKKDPALVTYDVTLVHRDNCDIARNLSLYGIVVNETRIPQGVHKGQLCGKDSNDFTEQQTGGVLEYLNDDGMPQLIGLTSFEVLQSSPKLRVFSDISHYLQWIECIVWS